MSLYSATNVDVPLKEVNVDVNVINNIAEFCVYQLYENHDTPVEIFYKFPTPAGASVYQFQAVIGDKVVKTVVKEKDEAKKEYNEAISNGHGAFMLNQNEGDVFSCCIGNVDKNAKINIEIKYSVELKTEIDSSQLRLVIPLSIMPRYTSRIHPSSHNPNTPKITSNPYKQSVSGNIFMSDGVESIDSKSDPVHLTKESEHNVKFELANIEKLDHDVNIVIKRKPQRSVGITELWKDVDDPQYRFATMLNIVPDFEKTQQVNIESIHYTLIIDRSGSMQGKDLENAKDGAMMFVNQLPDVASFDVYHFGSDFELFKPTPDGNIKDQAIDWITKIRSNGGTELYAVMDDAYNRLKQHDKPGVIIILTDGGISNVESVIKLVKSNPNVNVFSIGIGANVSKQLVTSLAEEGHGKAEFVASNDDGLQEKVISLLLKSQQSVRKFQKENKITVVTDGPFRLIPDVVPTLYENDVNTFYVFSATQVTSVEYSQTIDQKVITKSVPIVEIYNEKEGYPIHRLAGVRLINNIQYGKTGSQIDEVKVDVHKQLIVPISINLGILSQYTSFIGVEYRKDGDKLLEQTVLKSIPLRMPEKYVDEVCLSRLMGSYSANQAKARDIQQSRMAGPIGPQGAMGPRGAMGVSGPIGINTVGTQFRNASHNVMSVPSNPQTISNFFGSQASTRQVMYSRDDRYDSHEPAKPKPTLKLTLDKFDFEHKLLGSNMLTSIKNEQLMLPVSVGDLIEITVSAIKGIYKVICLGSESSKWVLKRFEF